MNILPGPSGDAELSPMKCSVSCFRKLSRLAFGGFFLTVVAGCSSIMMMFAKSPKVEFDHMTLSEVSLAGATALISLKVENPNSMSLKVDTLRYDVDIGGHQVASGQIAQPIEIAGHETKVVDIPVPFQYGGLFSGLLGLIEDKTTEFRVKGEAAVGSLKVPFEHVGSIKLE